MGTRLLLRAAFGVAMSVSFLLIAIGLFQVTTEAATNTKKQELNVTKPAQIEYVKSLKDVVCKTSCIVVVTSGLDAKFRINGIEQQGNGIRLVRNGDVEVTFELAGTHRNWATKVDPIKVNDHFANPNQKGWDDEPVITLVVYNGYGEKTVTIGPMSTVLYVWSPD